MTVIVDDGPEATVLLHIVLYASKSDYACYDFYLSSLAEAQRHATILRRMAMLIANYRGPWPDDYTYDFPDGMVFNEWFAFARADIYQLIERGKA